MKRKKKRRGRKGKKGKRKRKGERKRKRKMPSQCHKENSLLFFFRELSLKYGKRVYGSDSVV